MLILLRNPPDDRIRELVLSIQKESPETQLVYLERAFSEPGSETPLLLSGRTFSMDGTTGPGITKIDGQGLLALIRDQPRILILP